MVLSCLRCMASEEDSGTVMKRSCQPSLHVNRRESKILQARSWQGESDSGAALAPEGELKEGGMLLPPHAAVPWGCLHTPALPALRSVAAIPGCGAGGPAAVCRGEGRGRELWRVGSAPQAPDSCR